jgi:uncharacterized membrane-anchored protein YhcB (DUF1043 family)
MVTIDLMLGILIGTVLGFLLSLLFKKLGGGEGAVKVKELKAEHEQYRKKVDDHFVNTAVLFKGLTDQYRDVYRHIASGAGDLCSEEAKALQVDMEETALLAQSTDVVDEQPVDSNKEPTLEEEPLVDINETNQKEPVSDEVPLAGESELPADLVEELKNKQGVDK